MADDSEQPDGENEDDAPPKSKKGLIVFLLAGLVVGGGTFGAVWTGALDSLLGTDTPEVASGEAQNNPEYDVPEAADMAASTDVAFHSLDPIAVSIGTGGNSRQIRLGAVLEIPPSELDSVILIGPRLQDGILSYLRAVEPQLLEDPTALLHIRSQLLRRARLIAGKDTIINLLVTDFVLD